MFAKIDRTDNCELCNRELAKRRKDISKVHLCTACCHIVELFERKAKRIFGA